MVLHYTDILLDLHGAPLYRHTYRSLYRHTYMSVWCSTIQTYFRSYGHYTDILIGHYTDILICLYSAPLYRHTFRSAWCSTIQTYFRSYGAPLYRHTLGHMVLHYADMHLKCADIPFLVICSVAYCIDLLTVIVFTHNTASRRLYSENV